MKIEKQIRNNKLKNNLEINENKINENKINKNNNVIILYNIKKPFSFQRS